MRNSARAGSHLCSKLIHSRLRMNLSQFEQAIRHRWRPHTRPREARDHRGEIVSSVEAILEFGEVAWHMFAVDGPVGSGDGGLDIAKGRVDPLERGCARRGGSAACCDDLMGAPR